MDVVRIRSLLANLLYCQFFFTIYFLLTQISLFKYIIAVNNGHESVLREIAPAARVVHRL